MEHHEAAKIFPLDEENIQELADDIRKNGLLNPIEIFEGRILDGRRRSAACLIADVEPDYCEVNPADPVAYVMSLNLHRRHLTPSQKSMVGARAREMYDRKADKRRAEAAVRGNKTRAGKEAPEVENLPQPGKARDAVGKAVGVSGKSIDYATKVLANGTPELVKAVDEGRMAVSTAAVLSFEPPEKQIEEATKPLRNRRYKPGVGGGSELALKEPEQKAKPEGEMQGKGVMLANEAINCLIRIPKNDPLRKRGFQIVTDWIKANK